MSFWKRLFGGLRKERQPFDWICRQSLGIDVDSRIKPAVSPPTVEMMARMRRKVARQAAASMSVDESRQVDVEIDDALARSSGALLLEEFRSRLKNPPGEAEGRPKQPDLIERGPASAKACKGQGR